MKYILASTYLLIFTLTSYAQTGHFDDFHDIDNWLAYTGYVLSNPGNEELQVDATNVGSSWQAFGYAFPVLNLTNDPFIQIKIRTSNSVSVRIDLMDQAGNVTNGQPLAFTVSGNNTYETFIYDFNGRFNQSWPGTATVNSSQINRLLVYFNPGGSNYTGTVFFDSLRIGSEVVFPPAPKGIRHNQLGFYPDSPKTAVVIQAESDTYYIVSSDQQDTVFQGTLTSPQSWTASEEYNIRRAVFTEFNSPGTYYLAVDDIYSFPFKIEDAVHADLTRGLLKSYYFHRASTAIISPWGEQWTRAAGHPDNSVQIHSSAATPDRPQGTIISSPRGWYDAGDYNKYMVNSGITVYSMLALFEHYPEYFDTLNTFIPESGNNLPDILDEILWNLRWMLTCQAPDSSVYHKVTDASFSGTTMPNGYTQTRYAVGRSTAAALNLAAVCAQAARIFARYENELPGFADSCLTAARRAYNWAVANPTSYFTENPSGISTGEYNDNNVSDEFSWARMELYITTRNEDYYNSSEALSDSYNVPNWRSSRTLGLTSLIHYRKRLTSVAFSDTVEIKTRLLNLANFLRNLSTSSAYGVVLNSFNWGSTAVAGNQGLVLLQAYRLTGDESYLHAALANLDYIMGRNATDYSFVTGFGSRPPMHPHHRMSQADGVVDPVPGMAVGGPNPGRQDNCNGYPSTAPAKSYVDIYCSYASNEPAINYTAATLYLAGGIEAIRAGASSTPPPVQVKSKHDVLSFRIFPNPANETITLEMEKAENGKISISDLTGKIYLQENISGNFSVHIGHLPQGIYIISVVTDSGTGAGKLVVK